MTEEKDHKDVAVRIVAFPTGFNAFLTGAWIVIGASFAALLNDIFENIFKGVFL